MFNSTSSSSLLRKLQISLFSLPSIKPNSLAVAISCLTRSLIKELKNAFCVSLDKLKK
nr:MAG TPA: hypothetical protein [Crassvirales sp.]